MSNVIEFLENMGADATMARMTAADYEASVAALDTDESSREALRSRDHGYLNQLLKGREFMVCGVVAPDEKPDETENPDPDQTEPGEEEAPK